MIAQQEMDKGRQDDFFTSKLLVSTYFVGTILSITSGRLDTCVRDGREIIDMPGGAF